MAKIVVISGIAYVGICEWKETKAREMEVRMINRKKHEINDIYVKMLINPEKPDVPLNKNDAFQKVQKRRVQEKR